MCFSGLFGKKKTTNTTQTTALPDVMKNYSYINNLAQTASQRPFQKYGTQASDFVAQINPQQTMGISGINSSVDAYKPYFQNATAATQAGMGPAYQGIDNYMSPYIKDVADTTGALMRQQYEQAQSGALGTAASSGAFGGDRAGIAAANMQQQNQLGYGSTMANIYNQGYTQALGASQQDLARQLQGGAQMAGLGAQAQQLGLAGGQAQIAAGSLQQQTEQAGKDALINQFMQEQGYPFQTAQFLANIYSMTGPAAGSTTTNTQQGSFWSDRRLKHDVQRIGHTDDGQPIYRFKYNGSDQTQIGLMADQVEKHRPDAVGTDPKTGYQYVDYDRATRKADGGGVAGPYQIAIGSSPGGAGYVSQNYVKPSEMLLADPTWIDSVTQQNEQRKTGLQDFIDNIGGLKDKWNEFQGLVQPKADGGAVDDKKTPQELGYLQPVLDAMKPLDAQGLAGASTSSSGSSGSGGGSGLDKAVKVIDTGIKVAKFFGLKDGGVAGGRHGYATDGGVADGPVWNAYTKKYEVGPNTPVVVEPPTGVNKDATGVVIPKMHPDRQFSRGTPLLTQADYGRTEPEFKDYTSHTYSSPAEAAVGANRYYEKAGEGVGDAAAIENANRIYAAINNGGEGLAPNEQALYDHYKKTGLTDDTQIAGLLGRYNVEAGQGINPNARNTLGGGHGTYGIMQARGPRFEGLAAAGGMTPEMLEAMPVTNGLGTDVHVGTMGDPNQQYEGGVKPYEDRNWLGQIFHNNDPKGTMNKDAMLSLMSGVGTMLASPSPFFLPTLGAGLAGAANTYMAREGQRSDITAQNLENLKKIANGTIEWNAIHGTDLTPIEYAKAANMKLDPVTQGLLENMGGGSGAASINPADINGFTMHGDIKVPNMNDYQFLQNVVQKWGSFGTDTWMGRTAATAKARLDEIKANGFTNGVGPDGKPVQYRDPIAYGELIAGSEREASAQQNELFKQAAGAFASSAPVTARGLDELAKIMTTTGAGAERGIVSGLDAAANIFGVTTGTYAQKTQQALSKALEPLYAQAQAGNMSPAAAQQLAELQSQLTNPNLEPAALRDAIATAGAILDHQRDAYQEYYFNGGMNDPDVAGDPAKFMIKYEREHPFSDAKERRLDYSVTPPLYGEPAPEQFLATPKPNSQGTYSQADWDALPTASKIEILKSVQNQNGGQ